MQTNKQKQYFLGMGKLLIYFLSILSFSSLYSEELKNMMTTKSDSLPGRCHTHQVWPQTSEERARTFFLQYQSVYQRHKHRKLYIMTLPPKPYACFSILLLIGGYFFFFPQCFPNSEVSCTVEISIKSEIYQVTIHGF